MYNSAGSQERQYTEYSRHMRGSGGRDSRKVQETPLHYIWCTFTRLRHILISPPRPFCSALSRQASHILDSRPLRPQQWQSLVCYGAPDWLQRVRAQNATARSGRGVTLLRHCRLPRRAGISRTSMAGQFTCRDPESWGPVSRLRQFDLTPCFEEGLILSSLLVVFVVLATFRVYALRNFEVHPRGRKSRWVLWSKLVRCAGAGGRTMNS